MKRIALAGLAVAFATSVAAQNLTPEELKDLIDQRVNELGPYEELLNDPDPARAMAALEIMMEQGDATLQRMALEFGLLSSDNVVRQAAFEAFLKTGPVLTVVFDGSTASDNSFDNTIRGMGATYGSNNIGIGNWKVGDFDEAQSCYVFFGTSNCYVSVNSGGVSLGWRDGYFIGHGSVTAEGQISGEATLYQVSGPVPFTIQLLE